MELSNVIDVTPFIIYFQENVYPKLKKLRAEPLDSSYTLKEAELWEFINKNYENEDFTTKRLEKDFGNAAFATVRTFCIKLTENGLLTSKKQSNKVIYSLKGR